MRYGFINIELHDLDAYEPATDDEVCLVNLTINILIAC